MGGGMGNPTFVIHASQPLVMVRPLLSALESIGVSHRRASYDVAEMMTPDEVHVVWGMNYRPRKYRALAQHPNIYFLENGWFVQRTGCYLDKSGPNGLSSIRGAATALSLDQEDEDLVDNFIEDLHRRVRLNPATDLGEYIFVPLQVESDTQLLFWSKCAARHPNRQVWLLDRICEAFPDHRIVLKAHPRDESTAERILRESVGVRNHRDVHFVSRRSTYDLVAAARCVVGINSTVLLEALTCYKPVCAMGEGVFSRNGVVLECNGDPAVLNEALSYQCDRSAARKFLRLLIERQIPYHLKPDEINRYPVLSSAIDRALHIAGGRHLKRTGVSSSQSAARPSSSNANPKVAMRDIFDRVVCVNLAHRPDRWESFRQQIDQIDWPFREVERVEAVDGRKETVPGWWRANAGAWGCYRSHLRILKQAIEDGVDSVLIFEDDAVFAPDFAERCREFLDALPPDWDMIYLGGEHSHVRRRPPTRINAFVMRPYYATRTHAFAVRGPFIKFLHDYLEAAPKQKWRKRHHVDQQMARLHRMWKHKVYCPNRWIVAQSAGYSDITRTRRGRPTFWNHRHSGASQPIHKAALVSDRPVTAAVMGMYRGGTSCTAGILWHLGACMGVNLRGRDAKNSRGYFEPLWLSNQLRGLIRERTLEASFVEDERVEVLTKWLSDVRSFVKSDRVVIGAKHPLLSVMGPELDRAWGHSLHVIAVDRDLDDIIESLRRSGFPWVQHVADCRSYVERFMSIRDAYLEGRDHLRLRYEELLRDPRRQVERIIDYLGCTPTAQQVEQAVAFVQPSLNHGSTVDAADLDIAGAIAMGQRQDVKDQRAGGGQSNRDRLDGKPTNGRRRELLVRDRLLGRKPVDDGCGGCRGRSLAG